MRESPVITGLTCYPPESINLFQGIPRQARDDKIVLYEEVVIFIQTKQSALS